LIGDIDSVRLELSAQTEVDRKIQFGQFLTPSPVAHFMASLFKVGPFGQCRLLDPGAGIGTLLAAFLDRCGRGELCFQHVAVDAFELDERLRPYLARTLEAYRHQCLCQEATLRGEDFLAAAVASLTGDLFAEPVPRYTHAILNPPYKKIRADSAYRKNLRRAGIETVNLYSAFVALALDLLEDQGQLVAIIPRSFCNGPYYRPFRNIILDRAAIRHLHLFHARNKTFRDDNVLQENIIIALECGTNQGSVTVSTSTDGSFTDLSSHTYPFGMIVFPNDPERFIHVPTTDEGSPFAQPIGLTATLADLGISVSTGPIVDFRMRQYLLPLPESGAAPLLYPGHFSGGIFEWPKKDFRKPNAIAVNTETEKCLYPKGFYAVVRRFSPKEEKRRIVASVVNPAAFPETDSLGFENHLNVFHCHRHGLPEDVAYGLTAFLNTQALDTYFRSFNGHTQVNATDLRQLRYPAYQKLVRLGKWVRKHPQASPVQVDEQVKVVTA